MSCDTWIYLSWGVLATHASEGVIQKCLYDQENSLSHKAPPPVWATLLSCVGGPLETPPLPLFSPVLDWLELAES